MSFFLDQLRHHESTIWAIARKHEAPPVLLAEDLYQEGLVILDRLCKEYEEFSTDYIECYLRTTFVSHCLNQIKYSTRQTRDSRKTLQLSSITDNLYSKAKVIMADVEVYPSSEDLYVLRQLELEAEEFLNGVYDKLSSDCKKLFDLIVRFEYRDDLIPSALLAAYKRTPSQMTVPILSQLLGWHISKTRRVLNKIKRRVKHAIRSYQTKSETILWCHLDSRTQVAIMGY